MQKGNHEREPKQSRALCFTVEIINRTQHEYNFALKSVGRKKKKKKKETLRDQETKCEFSNIEWLSFQGKCLNPHFCQRHELQML